VVLSKPKLASLNSFTPIPVDSPLSDQTRVVARPPLVAQYELAPTSDSEIPAIEEQNQAARRRAAGATDPPQQQQQRQQQNSGSNDRSLDLDQDEDVAVPRRDNENIDLADLCGCSGGVGGGSTMGEISAQTKCGIGVAVVLLIGLIILLASSFADVHYYEYGFIKSRSTGSVDTSAVYESGRHFVGPDKYFKTFPATAHIVSLRDIEIFTRDKLEVTITVNVQYFLNKDDLAELHQEYDIFYKDVFKQTAKDVVKGAVTTYATRQFVNKRPEIEQKIFTELRKKFSGICCDPLCEAGSAFPCIENCLQPRRNCTKADKGLFSTVRYFQLGDVKIPQDVQKRYLLTLTRQLDSEKEKFIQESAVVRKNTEQRVRSIQNEASEIRKNATAEAELIQAKAEADAKFKIESSHREGLKKMYSDLGVTDDKDKSSITFLRSISQNDDIHISVGFTDLRLQVPGQG